jgi:hypothetical protein
MNKCSLQLLLGCGLASPNSVRGETQNSKETFFVRGWTAGEPAVQVLLHHFLPAATSFGCRGRGLAFGKCYPHGVPK